MSKMSNHKFFLSHLSNPTHHQAHHANRCLVKKPFSLLGVLAVSLALTACNKGINPVVHEPSKLVSLAQNPTVLQPIANFKLGGGNAKDPLNLQPVIQANHVFVASRDGQVKSYPLASDAHAWSIKLKTPITSGITADATGQTLVVTHKDGSVTALNAQNGAVKWQRQLSGTVLAPALIANARVLLMANDGNLYGLNLHTGEQVWRFNTSTPAMSVRGAASPILLTDNLALFAGADGRMYGLTVDAGLPQWSYRVGIALGASAIERMTDIDATPVVDNNQLFVVSHGGQLVGFDLTQQRILWQQDTASLKRLAITDTAVIATDLTGKVLAFHRKTGEPLWQNESLMYRQLTNPVVINHLGQSLIAVGDFEGYVHMLDAQTGDIVSRIRGQGSLTHLNVMDNRLVTQSIQGDMQLWQW